jgi:polyketide cyclase/dehydrase/lipid transport protein
MLVCRHQAQIPAPVRSVWELVGDPNRHPEWWDEVVEIQGTRFGRGCSYCQVSRKADGVVAETFVIERLEDCREILVRCDTGLYMRWLLTESLDGTFVDAEFGLDPERTDSKLDPEAAKAELRGWLQRSLDSLADATALQVPGAAEPASGTKAET